QEINFVRQFTAGLLPTVVNSAVDDALHFEARRVWIATCRKRLVARPQEALLRKPPGCLKHHDVRWKQTLIPLFHEVGEDGPDARIGEAPAWYVAGLHQVRRGLVPVISMRHAADQRILVRLLRKK